MKNSFSSQELDYLQDQDFLLTKVQITNKLSGLLAQVREDLKQHFDKNRFSFPEDIDLISGKISKGENYKHLPYLILDFPKLIHRESVFTLRTMVWWGQEFSCTLHLQGKAWEQRRVTFAQNYSQLFNQAVYFCVHPSPWEYHFDEDNYQFIENIPEVRLQKELSRKEFLKISRRLPLSKYSQLSSFVLESWGFYEEVLA